MELDALDVFLLMPHAHDRAVGELTRDLEAVGQRRPVDDQGVVAADLDVLRQSLIETAAVVADSRDFAVDDLARAHDLAAEYLADGLMAEADAEDWHFAAELADDIFADARIPRDARPRRDDDARVLFRLDLGHCRLVMADDLDVRAKLRQQLVDVVGKGVVIIYRDSMYIQ